MWVGWRKWSPAPTESQGAQRGEQEDQQGESGGRLGATWSRAISVAGPAGQSLSTELTQLAFGGPSWDGPLLNPCLCLLDEDERRF